jgi:hypothetical protein
VCILSSLITVIMVLVSLRNQVSMFYDAKNFQLLIKFDGGILYE